ncbi:helix-turn-helix domain-containing protein [Micromonospora radicis]|uniref:MarR family transcriptional regulator n=1 Tax=Micromonospora radicis TaxID=1894971 RepID=A0A418MTC2_9ACTN|nr:MarR family transcriptional regulator [Micromonospora radicis]RIV37360.1 MarR family transcriptional regulator [Micromonospora radicis]
MSVTLNGQLLGRTHHATRALLERELTALGLTFAQSLLLTVVAAADAPIPVDQAVRRLVDGLKTDAASARGVLAELVDAALVAPAPGDGHLVSVTERGRVVQSRAAAAGAAIGARLWADLPVDDVAAAARVLETVRHRAEAEVAAR